MGNPYASNKTHFTAQKMKFSIKDFFSKCDQIRSFLRIWSNLLKKSSLENFIFCAVIIIIIIVTIVLLLMLSPLIFDIKHLSSVAVVSHGFWRLTFAHVFFIYHSLVQKLQYFMT